MEKLNEEKQSLIRQHLLRYWHDRKCPICNFRDWNIPDTLFEIRSFAGPRKVVLGGVSAPLVALICSNCGYVILFNALKVGIIKDKQSKRTNAK